jgi:hypothetical protein
MLFNDDELAAYPGTEGITPDAATLLRDLAEARIFAVVPEAVTVGSLIAKGIALEVVARAYRNPNGYAAENVDDYGYRRDRSTSSAGVYLTGDERAELLKLDTGAQRSRARSVRLRAWSGPDL